MIEVEPQPKPEVKPKETPRIDLPVTVEIYFDIDEEMHRRQEGDFPLDDYEDLGSYIDRAYD